MKRILLSFAILLVPVLALADNNRKDKTPENEPIPVKLSKKEIVKTGWNIGLLPAFRYDNDLGFQFGALSQLYHYGDGLDYPNYRHKVVAMASVYSRGAKQFSLDYDSKQLLWNLRVTAHLEYMDNPLHGFYGFNGAVAPYFADLDRRKSADGTDGIAFYSNSQHLYTVGLDLQGRIADHLTWIGGVKYAYQTYTDVSVGVYDGTQSLFHQYVENGLIPDAETWGHRAELKGGLVYDTRDFEANPARGLYATVTLAGGASFSSGQSLSMVVAFDVRQYLPIVPSRLTLAWQVKGGGLVAGSLPFYALPSFEMRGSFGNRIVGADVFGGSLDLRLRLAYFQAFKQNFELGLVGFADAGAVIRPYRLDAQRLLGSCTMEKTLDGVAHGPHRSVYDTDIAVRERLHTSVGGGFFFSMNHNFITAVEFGHPLNPQDGTMGIYVNLGFSF